MTAERIFEDGSYSAGTQSGCITVAPCAQGAHANTEGPPDWVGFALLAALVAVVAIQAVRVRRYTLARRRADRASFRYRVLSDAQYICAKGTRDWRDDVPSNYATQTTRMRQLFGRAVQRILE